MRRTRLKSLTLPLLAVVAFNLLPQLYLRSLNYNLLAGLFLGYRFAIELLGMPMAPKLVVFGAQILAAVMIWQDFGSIFSDGASGALLTLLACLKTYELRQKRDYFVSVCLCFLVLMSYLLIDQSLLLTAFLLVDMILLLSFMYALETELWSWGRLKDYAKPTFWMLVKASPLVVACFVLFPRFSTGFGAGNEPKGKTGMTDRLQPGAVSGLVNSDELVFRASYLSGDIPPKAIRYWRGAVLDVSEGLNWSRSAATMRRPSVGAPEGANIEVHLEPGFEKFIFAPENTSAVFFGPEDRRIALRDDGTYELAMPLKVRDRYFVNVTLQPLEDAENDLEHYLLVDREPSANMRKFLQKVRGDSNAETVGNLMRAFRDDGYFYSMQPPVSSSIDDFMFKHKTGFCEHYAASMATMLRHMRVPARVVTGFQGGTESFLENYVTVRARDAHAWVEYWDDANNRWRRSDPTAQVAPLRLSLGSEAYLSQNQSWLSSILGPSYLRARAAIDEVDAAWVGFLLRFDLQKQKELLGKFGMEAAVFRALPVFLALAIVLVLAFLYFAEAQRREVVSKEEKLYRDLWKRLKKLKAERRANEGPMDYLARLRGENPELAGKVAEVLEPLVLTRYAGRELENRRQVARAIAQL